MSLDEKTISKIARLARISINDDEVAGYQSELSRILKLFGQFDAINTDGIEPMAHPFDSGLTLRDDRVTETNEHEKLQAIAPNTENGLYLVPKVVE